MNALLYAANTIPQDVEIGGTVNFGTPVRRYGKNLTMSAGNVVATGEGDYIVDASINFTGSTGTTVFTMYENGMPIPGARVERTTGAATEYDVKIPTFTIRNKCCLDKTLTMVITGAAVTDAVATINVVKV